MPLIAGILGVLLLALAAWFWFGVPWYPKRAAASLIVALVAFAVAWFQSRRA
jgi:hypothetical protein